MTSGRLKKAKQGQRLAEARKAISAFEKKQSDWGYPELAIALKCSNSQARMLVATLTIRGHLEPREAFVRKLLPMLTDAGRTAKAA